MFDSNFINEFRISCKPFVRFGLIFLILSRYILHLYQHLQQQLTELKCEKSGVYINNQQQQQLKIKITTTTIQKTYGNHYTVSIQLHLLHTSRDVNVFIFQKNDRFVMKTTTKNRKRNDRF